MKVRPPFVAFANLLLALAGSSASTLGQQQPSSSVRNDEGVVMDSLNGDGRGGGGGGGRVDDGARSPNATGNGIDRIPTEQQQQTLWQEILSSSTPASFTVQPPGPVCGTAVEGTASWDDLSEDRQAYYASIGWTKQRWDRDAPQGREISYQEFNPRTIRLKVPALQDVGFDLLGELLASHQAMLRGGTFVGDDELPPRDYMPMKGFLDEIRTGSTQHYLKYDAEDESWKESIQKGLGIGVLDSLLKALDGVNMLPGKPCGGYAPGYAWTFWVGAAGTITGMHYDDDDYGFLYVTSGRKRIVVIPNDERTLNYTCETYIEDHSCWTGIDVLNGPLPPHAVEFEIGPGEGIFIPSLAWHAVMNLEPTIAFGIFLNQNDFC
jgi:Cupin-like domain